MMHSMSLTMMRRYQPLTNSSLSDQGASFPFLLLQYWLYSCLRHKEPEPGFTIGTAGAITDVSTRVTRSHCCYLPPEFTYALQANPDDDRARAEDAGGDAGQNDETVEGFGQVEGLSS